MRFPDGSVYIASASARKADAADMARELRKGRRVVSSWHDLPPYDRAREGELGLSQQASIAAECLAEIDRAGWVLAMGHPDMRGALWECGYAMGRRIPVVWIGCSPTLFSALAVRP